MKNSTNWKCINNNEGRVDAWHEIFFIGNDTHQDEVSSAEGRILNQFRIKNTWKFEQYILTISQWNHQVPPAT